MAFFPFFIDLEDKNALIVGGGKIAIGKIEKLLPFGGKLTVVAPKMDEKLLNNPLLVCMEREFRDEDIEGKFFVIAATDDEKLNGHISELCKEKGILVNVVDDGEKCDFLFPSLIQRGQLTVGVSTGGASPQAAVILRKLFEQSIPEEMEEILEQLTLIRKEAKQTIPDSKKRMNYMKSAAQQCMQKGRVLTEEELFHCSGLSE